MKNEEYYKNKGKKVKQVAYCPSCKQEFPIKNIVRVVKCNRCGYRRPADKKEL